MVQSFPTRHARQYRKKTNHNVVIEAALLGEDNASEISNWANGAQVVEEEHALLHTKQEGLNVVTTTGKKRASVGQYVAKIGDAFFVLRAGEFEALYEEV